MSARMDAETTPEERLDDLFRLTPKQAATLEKLKLVTAEDLLLYFPTRYQNLSEAQSISAMSKGAKVTIFGTITSLSSAKTFRSKIPLAEATIQDATGSIKAVWFHQPYVAKILKKGMAIRAAGTISERKGGLYLANPIVEPIAPEILEELASPLFGTHATAQYYPVYSGRGELSPRWFHYHIERLLKAGVHERMQDPISDTILKKYHLPSLKTALVWIHAPRKEADAQTAQKRFAFQEIFFIQLGRLKQKKEYAKHPSFRVEGAPGHIEQFLKRFPFAPTKAQQKAIAEILTDLAKDKPAMRLLEGDVGSGKTLVAAAAAYAIVVSKPSSLKYTNLQVAYMAPTEILAKQHFESFISYFSHLPIQIGLITGSECRKFPSKVDPASHTGISRAQFLKWVASGDISIVIGTHALIQKSVKFKNLACVIIDEQHRFGVMQRMKLSRKGNETAVTSPAPHLLSMTATPIPRTLALTLYGDLDLTLINEMPAGRKPIVTEIVTKKTRGTAYEIMHREIKAGRQAYIICPRIDEPDPEKKNALDAKSVVAEAKRLQKEEFPDHEIAVLHGKMTPKNKDEVMERFASGEVDILVATSVVEVGVNVPNASVILIEGAERFGLAQLHQLRGRVLRSSHQAYCFVLSDSGENKRLSALAKAKNGFELAELDLELRGAGELSGGKQWGVSDIGMQAIKNLDMVTAARTEAQHVLDTNDLLLSNKVITQKYLERSLDLHFE
jgi:ATP-dependent DNA helicase RecG